MSRGHYVYKTFQFYYLFFISCFLNSLPPLLEFGPDITLTWSLEMASNFVEVVKVELEGQGFSCLEAAIGGHGMQVM
jgi:hypothetical protein